MKSVEKTRPGCGDHGSRMQACVSFRVSWPEMKAGAGDAAARMNAAVLAATGFPAGQAAMESYGDQLIERWRVEHKGVVYADSTWFERRIVQVVARRPGVWSLEVIRTGQTGAALPFIERTYLNLDPATGSPVTLDGVLESGVTSQLETLAQERLRKALSVAADAALPLKAARFALPREFGVTSAGLLLAWRGDELRNPAAAPVELTLPWRDVRGFVRQAAVKPPGDDAEQGF
jgi:hypothetical protein